MLQSKPFVAAWPFKWRAGGRLLVAGEGAIKEACALVSDKPHQTGGGLRGLNRWTGPLEQIAAQKCQLWCSERERLCESWATVRPSGPRAPTDRIRATAAGSIRDCQTGISFQSEPRGEKNPRSRATSHSYKVSDGGFLAVTHSRCSPQQAASSSHLHLKITPQPQSAAANPRLRMGGGRRRASGTKTGVIYT